jgi:hypothetical protein
VRVALWAFALGSAGGSLLARVVYRGPYLFGWEILGAAHGQFLLAMEPFWSAVGRIEWSSRHCWFWSNQCSLLYTIPPALLGSLYPSQHWAAVVTFALALATFAIVTRATGLRARDAWLALLAWGAAPELLSFAVSGYPAVTALLPQALAVWMALDERLRQRPVTTALLCAATSELSWHLYETGRLWFAVLLAAATLVRDVPLATRAVWIVASIAQVAALVHYPTSAHWIMDAVLAGGLADFVTSGGLVVRRLFLSPSLGLPTLVALGAVCLVTLRRHRAVLGSLLLFHLALIVALGLQGEGQLLSRRFCVVELFAIVPILLRYREARERGAMDTRTMAAIVAVLAIGNAAQVRDLIVHTRIPVEKNPHPLPFTWAPADNVVHGAMVDWTRSLRERAEGGDTVVLLYNFSVPAENVRDPAAVLERLYLELGHEKFLRHILVFGSEQCRYSCLPIRPLEGFRGLLEAIDPAPLSALHTPMSLHFHRDHGSEEVRAMLDAASSTLVLGPATGDDDGFVASPIYGRRAPADEAESPEEETAGERRAP